MTSSEIVERLLSDQNITIKQLADMTGLNSGMLYDLRRGKTRHISQSAADKIVEVFPNYNRLWLVTGNPPVESTTNVNVDMGDTITGNSGNVATRGASVVASESDALERLIEEKDKRIAALTAQVESLMGIIANLTAK